MESIIRNVKDIDGDDRCGLENVVGKHLQDNQQVIIHVIDVGIEPDEETRRAGLKAAREVARQGRANAAAQGVTEEEAGQIIDEAIRHVRQQKRR